MMLQRPQARVLLGLAATLALVMGVYLPGLLGGFVFDDYSNIVTNRELHVSRLVASDWIAAILSSPSRDLPRPLALATLAANHYFTGLAPAPMKLTNIVIHLVNCVLAFALVRRILTASHPGLSRSVIDACALGGAALWALLPINLTAVLLIVQRMESLANLFVLLGLVLYLDGRRRQLAGTRGGWHLIVGLVGCTSLGVACKESAALLPAYALALEFTLFQFRGPDGRWDRRLAVLFLVVLVLPALAAVAWLTPKILNSAAWAHRTFDLEARQLTEFRVLVDYLRWTVLPNLGQLSLFHDDYVVSTGWLRPWTTLAAFFLLLSLAVAGWLVRRRRPIVAIGIAWFFTAHVLTGTVIPLELVFEHRNYFASLGVVLVLLDFLLLAPSAAWVRTMGLWSFIGLLVLNAATTFLRANEWSDPLRFAHAEAAKKPASPRATYHYAQTLANSSAGSDLHQQHAAAMAAFERARRVPNASIAPAQGQLLLAAKSGRPVDSGLWLEINERLRRGPIGPQEIGTIASLTACVIERLCRFDRNDMMRMFMAVQSHGENPEVLLVFGTYALRELNNPALAESSWTRAEQLDPGQPQYVIALARLYISQRRDQEALAAIGRLRAIGPAGRTERAARELEQRLLGRDSQ